jgi:hypothetical protein
MGSILAHGGGIHDGAGDLSASRALRVRKRAASGIPERPAG